MQVSIACARACASHEDDFPVACETTIGTLVCVSGVVNYRNSAKVCELI